MLGVSILTPDLVHALQ